MAEDLFNKGTVIEENLAEAREILIEHVSISTYLNDNGFWTPGSEGKIKCPSPFHEDSTPSFHYDDATGQCNCFGCSLGGSIVELNKVIKSYNDDSYNQVKSILDLAKTYKIRIPDLYTRSRRTKVISKNMRKRGDDLKYPQAYLAKINNYYDLVNRALFTHQASVDDAMEAYKVVDDVWLGNITSKEGYTLLRKMFK